MAGTKSDFHREFRTGMKFGLDCMNSERCRKSDSDRMNSELDYMRVDPDMNSEAFKEFDCMKVAPNMKPSGYMNFEACTKLETDHNKV